MVGRRFSRRRPGRRALAVAVGAIALLMLKAAGLLTAADDVLIEMGFDPDRAALIEALTAAGIAALLTGAVADAGVATLVGLAGLAALFGRTFVEETAAAVGSLGPASFDASAWLLTAVTLVTIAAVIGWALGVVGVAVRRSVSAAVVATRTRMWLSGWRGLAEPRLAIVVIAAALVAISLPTFADLINYSPDALFAGGGDRIPLAGPPGNQGPQDPVRMAHRRSSHIRPRRLGRSPRAGHGCGGGRPAGGRPRATRCRRRGPGARRQR